MNIKILVVDESATIHKIVATAFETHNATVESVTKGEGAIAKVEASQPDIVLADADMPRLSGYDLSRQIKESTKCGGTPVLLLIGKPDAFDQETFNSSQADGYIEKPFKFDNLVQKVQHLLSPGGADALSNPVEYPQPMGKTAGESLEIGDSMIDMDDMMTDIISKSGLETNSPADVEEVETVESDADLATEENPLLAMDDIMSDIIGDSDLEEESISRAEPESVPPEKSAKMAAPQSLEESPAALSQKIPPTPIKLSLSQKIEKTTEETFESIPTTPLPTPESAATLSPEPKPAPSIPEPTEEKSPEVENNAEDINLEEMLKSAEALLEDNEIKQKAEKKLRDETTQEPEEKPSPPEPVIQRPPTAEPVPAAEVMVPETRLVSEGPPVSVTPEPTEPERMPETPITSTQPNPPPSSPPAQPPKAEESLAEVEGVLDSADDLDSTFQTIQQFGDQEKTPEDSQLASEPRPADGARSAFEEDMAQFEIKPEPEDLLERLAPSAFTASGTQGKPDLIKETLSYLSDLSPKKSESVIPSRRSSKPKAPKKTSKTPQSVKRKEISMDTEHKGDLFVQIVGEHIKRILERSLEESIAKEISGLSATIERSVREIVKEVTPEISRSIIQEEIEKIRNLEEV